MVFGQWTRAASSVSGNRERQGREGPRAGARLGTFHQLWNHKRRTETPSYRLWCAASGGRPIACSDNES
jgi:hypothetical protein